MLEPGSLIDDLLDMNIGGTDAAVPRDLLSSGLDQLFAGKPPEIMSA